MAFKPAAHENILFPVPYAENEQHPLIITNKRIVQRSDVGEVELPTDDVHTVSRSVVRPRAPLGVMLLALALPLLGFGAYELYTVWGMPAASPLSLVSSSGDDAPTAAPAAPVDPNDPSGAAAGSDGDPDALRSNLLTRALGIFCVALALGLAIAARILIRMRRFFVIARGNKRVLRMRVKDDIQQTQVMVTVSAVKGKG